MKQLKKSAKTLIMNLIQYIMNRIRENFMNNLNKECDMDYNGKVLNKHIFNRQPKEDEVCYIKIQTTDDNFDVNIDLRQLKLYM